MKTTILFVKIDFFFQYFLFLHFVFDNIPDSPIIKSKSIHDNADANHNYMLSLF